MTDAGDDQRFMEAALREASAAERAGEVPIGAVVVYGGEIVGRGCNAPIASRDPTAHAEVAALRAACQRLNNYRLPGADLYVTVEPCVMCVGAIIHARLRRVVFGCADAKAGALGGLLDVPRAAPFNHHFEIVGGVREAECRALLQDFFRRRRVHPT